MQFHAVTNVIFKRQICFFFFRRISNQQPPLSSWLTIWVISLCIIYLFTHYPKMIHCYLQLLFIVRRTQLFDWQEEWSIRGFATDLCEIQMKRNNAPRLSLLLAFDGLTKLSKPSIFSIGVRNFTCTRVLLLLLLYASVCVSECENKALPCYTHPSTMDIAIWMNGWMTMQMRMTLFIMKYTLSSASCPP